jgi:Ca2+-dependent lipid-binding protein
VRVTAVLCAQLRIAFATRQQDKLRLRVTIAEARELPAADRGGTSDPFVKLKVGRHQAKTEIIKKTLDPVWDAEFAFDNLLFSDALDVTVPPFPLGDAVDALLSHSLDTNCPISTG